MKKMLHFTFLCVLLAGCSSTEPGHAQRPQTTFSSFDRPVGPAARVFGRGEINVKGITIDEFLKIYAELSGRNIIRPATLPAPTFTLRNETPLNRIEALQLFDSVLAQNGIAMILAGEKSVKAVPLAAAGQEAGPVIDLRASQLPDSGSFMVRLVHLKKSKPSELVPMLQPFARVPNGIIPMDPDDTLVLRDFSSNIRLMLQVIDAVESRRTH